VTFSLFSLSAFSGPLCMSLWELSEYDFQSLSLGSFQPAPEREVFNYVCYYVYMGVVGVRTRVGSRVSSITIIVLQRALRT
jgi:hypothetical protein